MSEETKHSPTLLALPVRIDATRIVDSRGDWFCDCRNPLTNEFVCRAVNAHEALVSACETTLTVLEAQNVIRVPELEIQLRAAIKLAKGGAA